MKNYRYYFSVFDKKFVVTITASDRFEADKLFHQRLKERTVIDDVKEPIFDSDMQNIKKAFRSAGLNFN